MKKPKKGWHTPNAWLLWKMRGWNARQIRTAFQILAQQIASRVIIKLWHDVMREDGYYDLPIVPSDPGER